MQFPLRSFLLGGAAALAVGMGGCSAGAGGGGLLGYPGGTISLADATTGAPITTSPSRPYMVGVLQLRFSITATETRYDGPYSVQFLYQQNVPTSLNGGNIYPFSFNQPCFTATENDTFTQASVPIVFNGAAANGQPYNYPSGPAAGNQGDPCHSGEFEAVAISDTKGHTVKFYYEEQ